MRLTRVMILAGLVAACTEPTSMPEPGERQILERDLPPIALAAGEEIVDQCYTWTLDNEETLYVNRVTLHGSPGIHHSNWAFAPDRFYQGPDELFDCGERDFNQEAAVLRGGVLFAQSTQLTEETQQFQPGVVIALPPRTRIISNLHLVNYVGEDIETRLSMELETIPEEDVEVRLSAIALSYFPLQIAPRARSQFVTDCEMADTHQAVTGRPLDFSIFYMLPHYHAFGDFLSLEVLGGPRDGETIWETYEMVGGAAFGGPLDLPFDLTGAEGLRLTCEYQNPGDQLIRWGNADGEMCVMFGYTDSSHVWTGLNPGGNEGLGEVDGVLRNRTDCRVTGVPSMVAD